VTIRKRILGAFIFCVEWDHEHIGHVKGDSESSIMWQPYG
jgi:hypothetical protein